MSDVAHSAAGVAWDLGDLYTGVDDPQVPRDLSAALTRAQAFESANRGKIATLTANDAGKLHNAVQELESLCELMDKPLIYAMLVHSARTDDPKHGALLSKTREERTNINKHLIFFDLEWIQLPDEPAQALLANAALAKYRHYLEQKRRWKPHYLSEPEEKILDEKANTGKSAFGRLFEETTAALRLSLEGQPEPVSLQEALARLYDPDRAMRKAAGDAVTSGLRQQARLLTFVFNTIVLDHDSDTRLRRFSNPIASRNLANEIEDKVVEALMGAAERNYPLVQRYYRLKGRLLGLDKLYDYDRYAPLFGDMPACDWPTARRIVQESYQAFSPKAGDVIRQFFDKNWIDAELRPSKRGGAFSSSAVPSVHPYILLNFTERLRDVMTLAHELGHGLHQFLSRGQGYLQCDTPLTTAEMASVFGEMLTFQRLQALYPDPRLRLAMLCSKIEDAFATVFRQVVLTRFELDLHRARKEQGELSADAIGELWMNANRAMFADSVEMTDGYACWWSYIGHFIRSPFYCYAYAFGELLVLALVQKHKLEGAAFVPKYLEMLAAGGSDAPHVLLAKLGVDVTDPGFWELGLRLLGDMVAEAERLAKSI
ncbi:MAG: M3 family oligoendopeptidase [Gemmataceae bacterium]|nr:M3 family oligoendopeptidase [Gemmataceae bacterium]MCI0738671.1 M3 family oligoendopeptidase [Gemmataceae bacterium]